MSHESSSTYDCSDSDTSSYLMNYKLPLQKVKFKFKDIEFNSF